MVLRGFKWQEKEAPSPKQEMFESLHGENEDQKVSKQQKKPAEKAPGSQRRLSRPLPIIKPKPPKKHPKSIARSEPHFKKILTGMI
jgi:hypothetical protein